MKIEKSAIGNEAREELHKALSVIDGSPFQLEDMTELVQRKSLKPGLLTSLLNATAMKETFSSDTFKYDEENWGSVLPEGKAYNAKGKDIDKDKPRQLRWAIPSFGVRMNVAPQDYVGRRKPGTTNEFLTETDVQAQISMKAQEGWDLFDEFSIAQLITTDTNVVRDGPFTSYNFYNEVVGTGVAAGLPTFSQLSATRETISMQLADTNVDHIQLFRQQRKFLEGDLGRTMNSAGQIVVVCGDNFYDQRYEIQKKASLGRPLVQGVDLASEAVGTMEVNGLRYDTFTSEDGIRYINYGSEIIEGTKLIPSNNGYMIPVGAQRMLRIGYAPAQTRTYANTEAQELYTWTKSDEFSGVTTFQESNSLFALINPQLVRHLTL